MCNFRKLKLFQTPSNLFWTCRQRNRRPVRLMRTKIEYLELIRMSLLRKPRALHSKIEASVFWQSTKFSASCYTEMVVHTNWTLKRGTLRLDLVNLVSLILTLEHPVMVQHWVYWSPDIVALETFVITQPHFVSWRRIHNVLSLLKVPSHLWGSRYVVAISSSVYLIQKCYLKFQ